MRLKISSCLLMPPQRSEADVLVLVLVRYARLRPAKVLCLAAASSVNASVIVLMRALDFHQTRQTSDCIVAERIFRTIHCLCECCNDVLSYFFPVITFAHSCSTTTILHDNGELNANQAL